MKVEIEELTIYDIMYERKKIKKPIRLIELFSGYGSQALALKYLGVKFEHWRISEWATKSIQAYNDLHIQDYEDYSKEYTDEEIIEKLLEYGVSINYNNPATKEQIKRQKYRKIYNNIKATNNLVNIQNIKGEDLKIENTEEYEYIMTYSFPCQDLSLAGKRKGMKDTSTRSGMLWEVERILKECSRIGSLPQILLMENVPQVHGSENVKYFNEWQNELEKLGYKNYFEDLIATDFGIPQTRNRCFMISILGEYSYKFPKKEPLKLKLSDLLEKDVNDKYYLKPGTLKCFLRQKEGGFPRRDRFIKSLELTNGKDLAGTLTALQGNKPTDNHICKEYLLIKNATKKGYLEATIGDGIDISSRMKHHRGTVQKEKSQTLTTSCDVGTIVGTYQFSKSDNFMKGKDRFQQDKNVSDTLQTSPKEGIVNSDLKIRKLTPKECFRLMGVKDEDFEKIRKNQSDSSLYHLAGDSIVVNVLMAIFKQLL